MFTPKIVERLIAAQDGELHHHAMEANEIAVCATGRHSGKLVVLKVPDVNVNNKRVVHDKSRGRSALRVVILYFLPTTRMLHVGRSKTCIYLSSFCLNKRFVLSFGAV